MNKNINCLCGVNFQFNYEEEVDLDQKPEYLDEIFKGTFMSSNCPACSKKHKPEFNITIIWKSKKLKMQVIPELDRNKFYRSKNENSSVETIIGFPEMADRLAVINDDLEPVIIETLKSFLLVKADENYPNKEINAWYHCKGENGIEFHLDGIRPDEVAVMRIPQEIYDKTKEKFKKKPKSEMFTSLRFRSYLSVQNIIQPKSLLDF